MPQMRFGTSSFQARWFVLHPSARYNRGAMENLTQTPENSTTRPRSEAQIAASRANGAKSQGPVTEEGKARAAKNSRRHGLLGRLTVMETERSEAFIDLSADLYANFEPLDEHERNLVDTMIIAIWRRTRALGMESAGLSHIIRKQHALTIQSLPPGVPIYENDTHSLAFKALVNNSNEQRVLDLLHRYEVRHTRAYDRALKSLLAYRKTNQTNPSLLPDNTPETAAEDAPDPASTPSPEPKSVPNEPKAEQHSALPHTLPATVTNRSPRWHRRQARLAKQRSKNKQGSQK